MAVLLVSGTWVAFISLGNVLVQTMAPDCMRARAGDLHAHYLGGLAAGSATWGTLASARARRQRWACGCADLTAPPTSALEPLAHASDRSGRPARTRRGTGARYGRVPSR